MASANIKYQPMTEEEMRVHALNLAVAGRKDAIRVREPGDDEKFADICVLDAIKYLAFLKGEAER